MIRQKVQRLNGYFDDKIAMCVQRDRELSAEDRKDEANFEKVQANVYDIFRTVLAAAANTCAGDPEAMQRFFLQKAEKIPSNWAAAYHKAEQHHDTVRMRIEQIKLETAEEIRNAFAEIWEGTE